MLCTRAMRQWMGVWRAGMGWGDMSYPRQVEIKTTGNISLTEMCEKEKKNSEN